MKSLPIILTILAFATIPVGCRKLPDYVVEPERMSQVMADMYVAKAVVEQNISRYPDDSSRMALKQSVLARHGVSIEQFDTSLVWYGHNPQVYDKVYELTVAELEQRSERIGTEIVHAAIAMGGDSAEVWPSSPYAHITPRLPSRMITFDLPADTSARPGDSYTWRIKVVDFPHAEVHWNLYALYTDGQSDWLSARVTPGDPVGLHHQIVLPTDSTRTLERLRGFLEVSTELPATDLWIDSISLIRKPLDADRYSQRYRVRTHPQL